MKWEPAQMNPRQHTHPSNFHAAQQHRQQMTMNSWRGQYPAVYQQQQWGYPGGGARPPQLHGRMPQPQAKVANGTPQMAHPFPNTGGTRSGNSDPRIPVNPFMPLQGHPPQQNLLQNQQCPPQKLHHQQAPPPPLPTVQSSPVANVPLSGQGPDQPFSESDVDVSSKKGIFGWTTVDSVNVPYVMRDGKRYVSVRIVEMKLLSNFPNSYPEEIKERGPLSSEFVTASEAQLLNEINSVHCAFEYGKEPFNTEDLIVTIEEFQNFYNIIKKHFPTSSTVASPVVEPSPEPVSTAAGLSFRGGWIQVNNTVVPYVIRHGDEKFVPLSVIRYAAGLLTDVPVQGVEPTVEECMYLNRTCNEVGVDFVFNKSTKFVSVQVFDSPKVTESVSLKELPKDDPFGHAEYHADDNSVENVASGQQSAPPPHHMPCSPPIIPMPPNMTAPRNHPPPPYPGSGPGFQSMQWFNMGYPGAVPGLMPNVMSRGQNLNLPHMRGANQGQMNPNLNSLQNFVNRQVPSAPDQVPRYSMPPAMTSRDAPRQSSLQAPPAPLQPYGSTGGMPQMPNSVGYAARAFNQRNPTQMLHGANQSRNSGGWTGACGNPVASNARQTAAPRQSPPASRNNPPSTQRALTESQKFCLDRITSMTIEGKVVSCINKGGFHYALLEALGRVFFPDCAQADFQNVIDNVLRLPAKKLQPDEEAAFIHLYHLPVDKLKCNKVVNVKDFKKILPQLQYMFEGRSIDEPAEEDKTSTPGGSPLTLTIEDSPMGKSVSGGCDTPGFSGSCDTPGSRDPSLNPSSLDQLRNYINRKRLSVDDSRKPAKSRRLEDTVNRLKQSSMVDTNGNTLRECSRGTPESETDSSRSDLLMQGSRSSDSQDRSETPLSASSVRSQGQTNSASHQYPPTSVLKTETTDVYPPGSDALRVDTAADGNLLITLD